MPLRPGIIPPTAPARRAGWQSSPRGTAEEEGNELSYGPHSRAAPMMMRPRLLVEAGHGRHRAAPAESSAVVVGAGVAGLSAAVVLAERGVAVTVLEAADTLGGRLGAWPTRLPDGSEQIVEHGFHAFFRHYYTWRSILRRADPELRFLRPVEGYPVISREWPDEDITGLPSAPPLSLLALAARSPSLGLSDFTGADRILACELLGYHRDRTYAALDATPAGEFLERLGMSDRAQAMLFEAFARSFFCSQDQLSAAELVAMFHFYFLGNPEGLGFDAPGTDYLSCIWRPLSGYLRDRGGAVRTASPVQRLSPAADQQWLVETAEASFTTRHVVLALDPGGLRELIGRSPGLRRVAPRLAEQAAAVALAPPFAVTRLWLDRDVDPSRATFTAVSREATLDSITCYHRLEEPSAQWARRHGGAVLELHAYSCPAPDADSATARMRDELAALWPETRAATVHHQCRQFAASAPAFPPGTAGTRPAVRSDARGVRLAGDYIELPFCAGLMERSAMTGVLAANDILDEYGAAAEPIVGVPQRGLLAGLTRFTRRR